MQDRLGDLRDLANHLNPSGAASMRQGTSSVLDSLLLRGDLFDVEAHLGIRKGEEKQAHFMGDAFQELEQLKIGIAGIRDTMERIKSLKQEAVQATAPEEEKRISEELTRLLDDSNRSVLGIKRSLERLKEENNAFSTKNPNSSEARMRENLHAAVTRKFREILREYQSVQTDYKQEVKEKVTRQVKIVFPDATDDEVSRMVADGDVATAQAIRMKISGQSHESLQNALSDLQDKYRDIRRLEQSVTELHQMFVDLATLVDAQGELLDQIEFSVNSAKDYTERAEKELISTRKHQKAAKKRMCWLSVCVIVLAVIVMMPIIIMLTR